MAAITASRASWRATTRWALTFGATAIAGIALRVWMYRSHLGIPNSDEAVMGLMARHVLDGQFTVFFWGNVYGGTLESLLAVPGFAIAGSSWAALRAVSLVIDLLSVVLIWRVGLRLMGERAAAGAAALFWIWPPFVLYNSTHEEVFYASLVAFSALLLLLALRIVERPGLLRVGLLGLTIGVGVWETPQLVPVAIPVIGWAIWKAPRALRHAWLAVLLAFVGASPSIIWNMQHHWASLGIHSGVATSSYFFRLRVIASPLVPSFLGLRSPWSDVPVIPKLLADLVYCVLLAFFAYGAYRTRRTLSSILYVVAIAFPFLFAIESQAADQEGTRYLTVMTPILILLFAQAMTTWARTASILAIAAALSLGTLHKMEEVPLDQPHAPRNLAPLIATLDRYGIDRVYTKYWAAYVIDFDTRERIIAVENEFDSVSFSDGQAQVPDDPFVFYAPYQREVKAARHGFVFFRQTLGSVPIVGALRAHGYRRVDVGEFVLFVPPGATQTATRS